MVASGRAQYECTKCAAAATFFTNFKDGFFKLNKYDQNDNIIVEDVRSNTWFLYLKCSADRQNLCLL